MNRIRTFYLAKRLRFHARAGFFANRAEKNKSKDVRIRLENAVEGVCCGDGRLEFDPAEMSAIVLDDAIPFPSIHWICETHQCGCRLGDKRTSSLLDWAADFADDFLNIFLRDGRYDVIPDIVNTKLRSILRVIFHYYSACFLCHTSGHSTTSVADPQRRQTAGQ